MRRFDPWLWWTASGGLLFLTIFQLHQPGGFLFDDNILYFLPCYIFDYEALRQGIIPQLNVYQYLGQSWLSDSLVGAFYPPIYIAMALAYFFHYWQLAIDWLCWIHLVGAAIVVQRFALLWGSRPAWAMCTGWLYLTLPFICCSPQLWVVNSYCAFYIPLALLAIERLIRHVSVAGLLALSVVKALFILSGHINYFALSLLFEVAYLGFRAFGSNTIIRLGVLWLTANGLAALASLPSLGPVLFHLRTAAHESIPLTLNQILDLHVDPGIFIVAQFGHWLTWGYAYQPAWMFLGGSVFLPALLLRGKRKRRVLLFLVLMGLALIFSTPAFVLIHYLPGYGAFRWPEKLLLFVALFHAMLFAALVRHLPPQFPRWLGGILFATAISCNLMVDFSPHAQAVTWLFHHYSWDSRLPIAHLQDGRSISIGSSSDHSYNPNFLNCYYASMVHVPVVGGYDVLIADQNRYEALDMFFGNYEGKLDDAIIRHLRSWSVCHYLVETNSPTTYFLQNLTGFHKVDQIGKITIFDDTAAPAFAYFEETPVHALPVTYHPNGIEVETGAEFNGTLSLSLVPLPGYAWFDVGAPNPVLHPIPPRNQGRMRIEALRSTTGRVGVVYREPGLNFFLMIGAVAWILGAIIWIRDIYHPLLFIKGSWSLPK